MFSQDSSPRRDADGYPVCDSCKMGKIIPAGAYTSRSWVFRVERMIETDRGSLAPAPDVHLHYECIGHYSTTHESTFLRVQERVSAP